MKKLIFTIMLVVMLALLCTSITLAEDSGETIIWEVDSREPFGFYVVSCTGEPVQGSGTLHWNVKLWIDEGGTIHDRWHRNIRGTGIGLWTGNEYGWNSNYSITSKHPGYPYLHTYIDNFELIAKGEAPNLKVRARIHFTYNANGDMTAHIDSLESICQ